MHLAWLTDVHFDFLNDAGRRAFARDVSDTRCDGVLLTGDISIASSLLAHLQTFVDAIQRPIFFVLGNHDYYGSSIEHVRRALTSYPNAHLIYLGQKGPIQLGDSVIIGVDGIGDGRLGDGLTTPIELNDFVRIGELAHLDRPTLLQTLGELGDREAATLDQQLLLAAGLSYHVVVATHVPPFANACWHEGKTGDVQWLPWFTCAAVGHALQRFADTHPKHHVDVYCGHTHGAGETQITGNLKVYTGQAEYGSPAIQRFIELNEQLQ